MTSMLFHNKRRSGFSLTEFAIVLGVVGVVLSGLWGVVSIVRENIKRTEMKEQLVYMVGSIRDHYLARSCASVTPVCVNSALLTNYLLQRNVLPYEQLRNRSAGVGSWVADHPWGSNIGGGSIVVKAGADASQSFEVEILGLEEGACVALASKLTGIGSPSGLTRAEVNNNNMVTLPVSPEDADARCNNANNRLDLFYNLRAQ